MTRLLDVNLLVALAWPNHIHHARALKWFRTIREQGWATCPLLSLALQRGGNLATFDAAITSLASGRDDLVELID